LLKVSAFAPAHVTGFFAIHDQPKKMRHKGSRGAGICLSKGVHSVVGITGSGRQEIEVFINNEKVNGSVTEYAISQLLGNESLKIKVSSTLELPTGQGFGMSGAGALSSCMALATVLDVGIKKNEVICAAHEAEVKFKTGLGDVLPQSVGGVVMRKMEGCPPFGIVEEVPCEVQDVVLCVVGENLSTKEIITNEEHRKKITEFGNNALRKFQGNPTIEEFMRLSYEFSKNTGLLSKELDEAVLAANSVGKASMSMLGNSVFAVGEKEKLKGVLEQFGDVFVCEVDNRGMRIE
jgi:pantoate kinase